MVVALLLSVALAADPPSEDALHAARVTLGERLFHDTRFDNPQGDMDTGCASCHMSTDPLGYRAFTERLSKSWHPFRNEEPSRETLRNTPTLLDLSDHDFIHFDGEFSSLQEQSKVTLTGRNFGWLESEKEEAIRHIAAAIRRDDASPPYSDLLMEAYGVDVATHDPEEFPAIMGRAIAEFVRTLKSKGTSPYDRFIAANGIDPGPEPGESPAAYGSRILGQLTGTEPKGVSDTNGFGIEALQGYEIFLQTAGTDKAGNCVVCHVPPSFSDALFHNAGVTQDTYDTIHGSGSFEALEIPFYSDARRPVKQFRMPAKRGRPGLVDLGYWNFARFDNSPLYDARDTEAVFLERCIATFKTPTLRNLAATDPYTHNGLYVTIEEALYQKVEAAFLTRMGQLRNPDPELEGIHISEDDIPALFAFLNSLNDAGRRIATPAPIPSSAGSYSGRYGR